MQLRRIALGLFQVNCYLLTDPATGLSALVDTSEDGHALARRLDRLQPRPRIAAILLTHAHVDHAGGLAALQEHYPDAVTYLPALERPVFESLPHQGEWFGLPQLNRPTGRIDRELRDGDELRVGELRLKVLSTPGHTPGHACYYDEEDLLSGDLLFRGSIGRTDFPLCDPRQMAESLIRVMELPLHLRVHSGHGPGTTLERELRSNPFLRHVRRHLGLPEPPRGPARW